MANNSKILILIGGVVAIVGQFWGADFYLPLIGAAIAMVIVALIGFAAISKFKLHSLLPQTQIHLFLQSVELHDYLRLLLV